MYPPDALRRFVQPGDLCFDIGAHEGKHTAWLLELGARVIAVEPQVELSSKFVALIGDVTLLSVAISDAKGRAVMASDPDHSYMSTLEGEYTKQVQAHAPYTYTYQREVFTRTLDSLIEEYGVPAFCKIDVEGHERKVFDGLSQALPALSFEVHDFDLPKANYCMDKLKALGDYRFWYAARESFELHEFDIHLRPDIFGDIYAVQRV